MAPTLEPGDRYLLKKNAYTHGPPRRGDVIVFHHPTDKGQILVKRVVGLPGEQLGIVDGRVAVNGERLREDYLRTAPFVEGPRWLTVPDGTVYVLGDNRSLSEDSRDFGPVALRLIIGRATRIIWPLGRAGRIR
jgi:signal peptidase I